MGAGKVTFTESDGDVFMRPSSVRWMQGERIVIAGDKGRLLDFR